MWSSLAGALTLKGYSTFSVAWITSPLGRMNRLSDGSPVRWLGPSPDVALLSAIVDGIVPPIIPRRSSSSSTPIMYCLFAWGIVSSTVLARIPFSCHCSNLLFHFSDILFQLRVSATGATLLVSLNVTRHSYSCTLTWHGGGDRQE